MRKILLGLIGITSLLLLFLIFNGLSKLKVKKQMEKKREQFPEVRIYDTLELPLDTFFNDTSPVFFILNPDCYFCEHQIEHLIEKREALRKLRLYLLIPSEEELYRKWKIKYADRMSSNMFLYRMDEHDYIHYFGEMNLPAILHYDTNKLLISSHQSFVKSDWILKNMTTNEDE